MFEGLSEKLERSFKVLKGQAYITEVNVADTMKEIRRALLDADVSYKIAKDVTNNIKEKALVSNKTKNIMVNKNTHCLLKQPNNAIFVWLFHYKDVSLHQEN